MRIESIQEKSDRVGPLPYVRYLGQVGKAGSGVCMDGLWSAWLRRIGLGLFARQRGGGVYILGQMVRPGVDDRLGVWPWRKPVHLKVVVTN